MAKLPIVLDDLSRASAGANAAPRAWRIAVDGPVQGIGFRPAVARLAAELRLTGSVGNTAAGAAIEVVGAGGRLQEFERRLIALAPSDATIARDEISSAESAGSSEFRIADSSAGGASSAAAPVDVAVCPQCMADWESRTDRRRGYAFASCAKCGPRYSIVDAMPYDRVRTAMASFAMCPACAAEYCDEADRRFHAQTNCCGTCGPRVWASRRSAAIVARDADAISAAVRALERGRIVALRGLGGYQLLVDATSEAAVRELRRRKRRHGKPLAVMVADVAAAERLACVSEAERRLLSEPANAIVVLSARTEATLAPSVTVGIKTIGLLLPTTPLHHDIARRFSRPLVATSGNREGEPLAFDAAEAEHALAGVADLWLHHDRPIVRPIDDSVIRMIAGQGMSVRLGRGMAPLRLDLDQRHALLALGGHQKTAVALANGGQAVLGPHVGDLDSEPSRRRFINHIDAMQQLYDCTPSLLIHDQHPDYFTTRWAAEQRLPTLAVQHHHAHIAAGMIEPGWLDREVLGVAWDGTGSGPDGSIWGGEFLRATASNFRRVARLRPFSLPGGERAIREPWRIAVAVVADSLGADAAAKLRFNGVDPRLVAQVALLAANRTLCPQTSSAGRIFDAVAALTLGAAHAAFDGQPAMLLECACDESADGAYDLSLVPGNPDELDWRLMLRQIVRDRVSDVAVGEIAMRFHRALAGAIVQVAVRHAGLPLVLGGGCFQNRILTELIVERLQAAQRELAVPRRIPLGDGGLAAGQLAIAVARLSKGWRPCV